MTINGDKARRAFIDFCIINIGLVVDIFLILYLLGN